MGRLPRLFRTEFESLGKNPIAADLGQFKVIFCFDIENGIVCVLIRIASMRQF